MGELLQPSHLAMIGLIAIFYFIPTMVAFSRRMNARIVVLFVNLFLGWTFIVWGGALVWAIIGKAEPSPIVTPAVQP